MRYWFVVVLVALLVGPSNDASALDKRRMQVAVAAGVQYLKLQQKQDGSFGMHGLGSTALVTLALIEAGVPLEDRSVQAAAGVVRVGAISEKSTYNLALAIMLLDKLNTPGDTALIQAMSLRLVAGQTSDGGWAYTCPCPTSDELEQTLKTAALDAIKLKTRKIPKSPAKPAEPKEEDPFALPVPGSVGTRPKLDVEIKKLLAKIENDGPQGRGGDNSNTQFALLALWVGRRHGVLADPALARVEKRFRDSQAADGSWGYTTQGATSASMTCAGLLGLAVGFGAKNELRTGIKGKPDRDDANAKSTNPGDDPVLKKGLLHLGKLINPLQGRRLPPGQQPLPQDIAALQAAHTIRNDLYFLWSLERVAMTYGLETVGDLEWHNWGAEFFIVSQQSDGSWRYQNGKDVGTAFALLFLKKANFVLDLSSSLAGKVRDPGKVNLKAGVGIPGTGPIKDDPLPDEPVTKVPDPEPKPRPKPEPTPPTDEHTAQVQKLADRLSAAEGADAAKVIAEYTTTKGVAYTDALAAALPKLSGPVQQAARDALVERLMRMTAKTLRDKLKDDNAEIRRAAALACGTREEKTFIADLIGALPDTDGKVARAAGVALKAITGQNFGPTTNATTAERVKAHTAWKQWFAQQAEP